MDKSLNRFRAFAGPNAEAKATRVGHFFKALMGDQKSRQWCIERQIDPITKASGKSSNTIGGFLTPVDFDNAIIAVRETFGAFRQGADVRNAISDSMVRPRRFGGVTANFVAEGATIPESNLTFDAVGASLRKMAVLCRTSSELFEDEAADLGDYLASEIGYACAGVEDDCGFNGTGSSVYNGISGLAAKLVGTKSAVTAASGHNTFLTLDTTDIASLMAGVLATAIPGAAWYTSATGYAQTICRLAAVSGGHTAVQQPDGRIRATYLGFPVRFSGKLPDVATSLSGLPMLYFGNLLQSSMIVERNTQMDISISRDRALDTDQVLIRGVQRLDIINHFVGDASTRGSVAMLVGG